MRTLGEEGVGEGGNVKVKREEEMREHGLERVGMERGRKE